jgi:hypothetical protein
MRRHCRTKTLGRLVSDDDAPNADPLVICPLFLDPAHVARYLPDYLVVALVSLEFDHDVIAGAPIPGEDVERSQRSTFDLPVQELKLLAPRERVPLLDEQILKVLLQGDPQVQRLGRNPLPIHGNDDPLPSLQMIEKQSE